MPAIVKPPLLDSPLVLLAPYSKYSDGNCIASSAQVYPHESSDFHGKVLNVSTDTINTGLPKLNSSLLVIFIFYWILANQGRQKSLARKLGMLLVSFFFKHFSLLIYLFIIIIILLYNVVLILPHINMNPPRVYMCSQSWTLFPPPSPYHLSGSSQHTSPKHPDPALNLDWRFVSYIILYMFQCHSPKSSHPLPLPQGLPLRSKMVCYKYMAPQNLVTSK